MITDTVIFFILFFPIRFKEKSTDYWSSLLNKQGISSSSVHSIKEAYDIGIETVQHIQHPTSGQIKVPGKAIIDIFVNIDFDISH